jgi:hypothetical protein
MQRMKKAIVMMSMVLVLGLGQAFAQAELIDRGADVLGNHLIYDKDLNITWYDFTKSQDNWNNQVSWAQNLTVNLADGRSFTGWRLPTTSGAGCRL